MAELVEQLENTKVWTQIDVKSPTSKREILKQIEKDQQHPEQMDPDFYESHKHKYSTLGQTNLELLKLSKPVETGLMTVLAAAKFKHLLKKKNSDV